MPSGSYERLFPHGTRFSANHARSTSTYISMPAVAVEDPEERRERINAENDRLFLASLSPDERTQELQRRNLYAAVALASVAIIISASATQEERAQRLQRRNQVDIEDIIEVLSRCLRDLMVFLIVIIAIVVITITIYACFA